MSLRRVQCSVADCDVSPPSAMFCHRVQCFLVQCKVSLPSAMFSNENRPLAAEKRGKTFHSAEERCNRWQNLSVGERTFHSAKGTLQSMAEPSTRRKNLAVDDRTLQPARRGPPPAAGRHLGRLLCGTAGTLDDHLAGAPPHPGLAPLQPLQLQMFPRVPIFCRGGARRPILPKWTGLRHA